jgi:CubicO group peptidase (beta-lactamase class C family)
MLRILPRRVALFGLSLSALLLASCNVRPLYEDRSAEFEQALRDRIDAAIADRIFPACSVLVVDDNVVKAELVVGRETYAKDAPSLTGAHRFDLASLTKVVATTSLAMALYDRGEIRLEDPVARFVPKFTGGGKQDVTLAMLLAHCSGLPPYLQLWKDPGVTSLGTALDRIVAEPLIFEPGTETRYSDLGMILLAACLERAGGESFAALCQRYVFDPLEMEATGFGPLPAQVPAVPTETVNGETIRAYVHDENAQALGGICGHAGLFSTARDLGHLLRCLIDGGRWGQKQVFKNSTVARFTKRALIAPGSTRTLGWDSPGPNSSSGRYFSARSIGHTGFTGTSIWIDLEQRLGVVILTNRVHPSRDANGGSKGIHAFRRAMADLVIQELRPMRVILKS